MKRIFATLVFLAAMSASGQVSAPGVRYVTTAPSGACSASPPIQVVISTGAVYTCNNGTWGTSSGGVTTSGSPLSGNIASFSAGTVITAATAAQVNTLMQSLTGCNTATYIYSPQSGTCVAPSAGTGTVTSFSAGNLSPLFTTSVATATSTPALTFALSTAAQNSVFAGPASGGAAAPSFQTAPTISAANMTNFPPLNQNTTGTAAGLSATLVPGSGGTGVANTATLTLGTTNQNWATLGTGIVKNTTTTGAISNAASSDVIGLWTGTCSSSTFLRGDGSCQAPAGSGTVNSASQWSPAFYAALGTTVSGTTPFIGLEYWSGSGAPAAASAAQVVAVIGSTAVANATSATTATNLAGGGANQIPFQTGAGATSFITAAASCVLSTNGSNVPSCSTTLPSSLSATSLTLVTPALGTPSSGVITNLSGTCASCTVGIGTNSAGGSVGAVPYQSAANTTVQLTAPTTSGHTFLLSEQPSGSAVIPTWLDGATYLASPPAIGGTAAAAGSFTTLSASSTVSGTGFSNYMASPPAIGGTAANAGSFTSLTSSSGYRLVECYAQGTATSSNTHLSMSGCGGAIGFATGTTAGAFPIAFAASTIVGFGVSCAAAPVGTETWTILKQASGSTTVTSTSMTISMGTGYTVNTMLSTTANPVSLAAGDKFGLQINTGVSETLADCGAVIVLN
jgi:hypothetical protein